jgi:uncharacterized membrane protein YdbT with pleckstrin-like domain
MGSYVDSVLGAGEAIVYRASISHWKFLISYLVGAACLIGAIALYAVSPSHGPEVTTAIAVMFTAGVVVICAALVRRQTTELVLTDRRIITKRGFIARDTVEMNLGKVESLHVNQGLLGRILDYGDVTVVGTGTTLEPLRGIVGPLELRKKLGEVQVGVSKSG